MALFLTILEGDTPEQAKPLIATRDKEIIRLVTEELSRRLGSGMRRMRGTELAQSPERKTDRRASVLRPLEG